MTKKPCTECNKLYSNLHMSRHMKNQHNRIDKTKSIIKKKTLSQKKENKYNILDYVLSLF